LPSALQGIEKFGHLISVDYYKTIISVIRTILNEHYSDLSVDTRFQCVKTAFSIYNTQSSLALVDAKDLYRHAYRLLLLPVKITTEMETTLTKHIGETVDVIFNPKNRQEIDVVRSAAFLKRLCMIAVRVSDPKCVSALLETIKKLFIRSPSKVKRMIAEDEEDRPCANGSFDSETDQIDICNPFSTWLSELHELKAHNDPDIRRQVKDAFSTVFSKYTF
jgi:hypothetical protein